MKLVLIEWEDSTSCASGWFHLDDNPEPEVATCYSSGWLIHDGKDSTTILPHFALHKDSENDQGQGYITIPNSAILKMVEIKLPKDFRLKRNAKEIK